MKHGMTYRKAVLAALSGTLALACSAPIQAGFVVLPGGWTATWDNSLNGLVQVIATEPTVINGAVHIQKSAEFTQPFPPSGVGPSIPIQFSVTAGYTGVIAPNIVIDDEIITNSTGTTWTDFHIDLIDSGDVNFDPVNTALSGGPIGIGQVGWTVSPFTNAAWANNFTRLDIFGGPGIPGNGGVWFPGDGATDGELWIHVNNPTTATTFTLKETPTVPAPGAVGLLAGGALLGNRRRRALC